MRRAIAAAVLVILLGAAPVCASGPDARQTDPQAIDALLARASQAQPREQCFLYAQLVHDLTELSMQQYANGDVDAATLLLKRIQGLAHQIHLSLGDDGKRLKNAQILLRRSAFRLSGLLHASSLEDQPLVAATLTSVNKAEDEAMLQVFRNK
jgi:hypothetical protein